MSSLRFTAVDCVVPTCGGDVLLPICGLVQSLGVRYGILYVSYRTETEQIVMTVLPECARKRGIPQTRDVQNIHYTCKKIHKYRMQAGC